LILQESPQNEFENADSLSSIDMARLLRTVWRGRRKILLIAVGTACATLIVLLLQPNVYTSMASFIPPSNSSSSSSAVLAQLSSSLGGGLLGGGMSKSQSDLYVGILKSSSVQDALVARFHLNDVYHEKKLSVTRKRLASASNFEADPKSSIITISVTDKRPDRARDIVNGYLDTLRETNSRMALVESSQRRLFYSEQLAREKDALANAEVDLKRTQEKSGLIAPVGQTAERIQNEGQLRAQLTAREVQLASLRDTASDDNIQVIQMRSEIAALQQHIAQLQSGNGGGDTVPSSAKIPEIQLDYIRKARDVKYHETLFEILARQYEAARLDESHEAPEVQVLDQASYPDVKSGPHRMLLTLVAFIVGLLGGAFYVWTQATWPGFRARVISSIDTDLDSLEKQ
jgi:tyrosine-protein kinase Etk/Wzc